MLAEIKNIPWCDYNIVLCRRDRVVFGTVQCSRTEYEHNIIMFICYYIKSRWVYYACALVKQDTSENYTVRALRKDIHKHEIRNSEPVLRNGSTRHKHQSTNRRPASDPRQPRWKGVYDRIIRRHKTRGLQPVLLRWVEFEMRFRVVGQNRLGGGKRRLENIKCRKKKHVL